MTRTRDEIELDLAFAVNGTLSAQEQAEIDAWLARDDLLRAEHAALAEIRQEMQAEEIRSPGDFGLARLLREVGREGAVPAAPPASGRTWMWQAAAAVALAALLAQTLLQGTPDRAAYDLAGAAPTAELTVSFIPGATEEQIRTLLVNAGVEIVAGPSALGFYDLTVLAPDQRAAATDTLRAAPDIIESIENASD